MVYKLSSIVVGGVSIYLGYKLFINGIWGDSGNLSAQFQDNKILLKNAAPGTFFSVLGAIIICFSIFKGVGANFETNLREYGKNKPEADTISVKSEEIPEFVKFDDL